MTKLYLDNLYRQCAEPRQLCCLLISDARHHEEGNKHSSVVVALPTGDIRTMYKDDFEDWYEKIEEIAVADLNEEELKMVRRANPGDPDMDFIKVFESWGESEMNMTGHMLELAVGSTMMLIIEAMGWPETLPPDEGFSLTIKTDDMQRFLQNYEVSKLALPHGFTYEIKKSFPDSA